MVMISMNLSHNMVEVMVPRSGDKALGLGQYGHKVNMYKNKKKCIHFFCILSLGECNLIKENLCLSFLYRAFESDAFRNMCLFL